MSNPEPKAGLSLVGEPKAPERDTLDRPCFAVYDRPVFKEGKPFREGTWYHGVKHSGPEDDPVPFDYWICSPLHVEAETVNTEDGSIGRLLSFRYRGKRIEWVMPMEALAGKADEVLKALMRQGLAIEYHQRRHVAPYLASYHAPARVIATTTKPGWHESGAFVLPSRVLGGDNVRYQDSGRAVNLFTTKGTLANWQAQIAPRCLGNPVLILSVCCALAGPLLTKLGVNGGGIHLVGDSSSGKSLAQLIAASVWGNPGTFAASWDVSKGGVEIEAASRNDTVLILDEIKRADPKRVQEMAYAIANGMGKSTMTREREGRAKLTWRVLALSSGERSLSEHAAIAGNGAHAGAELRMVDVNAGTRPFRAFDDVQGLTGQEFHRLLTDAVGQDYGHLGPAFVESLLKTPEDLLERFRELRATFRTESSQGRPGGGSLRPHGAGRRVGQRAPVAGLAHRHGRQRLSPAVRRVAGQDGRWQRRGAPDPARHRRLHRPARRQPLLLGSRRARRRHGARSGGLLRADRRSPSLPVQRARAARGGGRLRQGANPAGTGRSQCAGQGG
ncbi:putative DNA primase/helicase [Pseudomonas psychrotolerans]|nr:putative DNA primase/helicase [Pseudomonas psychrotolerans]